MQDGSKDVLIVLCSITRFSLDLGDVQFSRTDTLYIEKQKTRTYKTISRRYGSVCIYRHIYFFFTVSLLLVTCISWKNNLQMNVGKTIVSIFLFDSRLDV